jgi:hypothetical protein
MAVAFPFDRLSAMIPDKEGRLMLEAARICRSYATLVLVLVLLAGCGKEEKPPGRVFFVEPADGAEVVGPVKVVMGVEGMTVKSSGEVVEGTGHHHIIIDGGPVREGQVIPTDATHRHFGKGETETVLELSPGDYKLTMQFADGLHRSYGEEFSDTISIKVKQE